MNFIAIVLRRKLKIPAHLMFGQAFSEKLRIVGISSIPAEENNNAHQQEYAQKCNYSPPRFFHRRFVSPFTYTIIANAYRQEQWNDDTNETYKFRIWMEIFCKPITLNYHIYKNPPYDDSRINPIVHHYTSLALKVTK